MKEKKRIKIRRRPTNTWPPTWKLSLNQNFFYDLGGVFGQFIAIIYHTRVSIISQNSNDLGPKVPSQNTS